MTSFDQRFRQLVRNFRAATTHVGKLVESGKAEDHVIQAARQKRDNLKTELEEFIKERGREHAKAHGEEEGRQHERDYRDRATDYHTHELFKDER